MTASVRIRLLLFAVIGLSVMTYAAIEYVRVDSVVLDGTDTVRVDLAESGGLYAGSEVTLRGVHVGRVTDVVLADEGVKAVIEIDKDSQIPAAVRAAVRNRSAVGEQYLDLTPTATATGAPYLDDGSVIPRADTRLPVPEEQLIGHLDGLVRSIPLDELRTVVSELGTGFAGTGADLQRLLDGSATLVTEAQASLPATLRLTEDALVVLQTQADGAEDIATFTSTFRRVARTVGIRDPELRRVIADAAPLAGELSALIRQLNPTLPPFLAELTSLAAVTGRHLPALEQGLIAIPHSLAVATNSVRNGRAKFSLSTTAMPAACQRGYINPSEWRSTADLSPAKIDFGLRCEEPGAVPRGTNNAPR